MFRCEQFFKVDNVPDESKVNLISIHLYDVALMWHRNIIRLIGENVTWSVYREAILARFGRIYEDPLAEIKKLKQNGSVQQYIDEYDKLLCRVQLSDDQAMSFFSAGLYSEIELAVRMFRPKSLAEMYGLCRLQESQLNVAKQRNKMPVLPTPRYNPQNTTVINSPKPLSLPAPNASWRNKPSTSTSTPYRKQLTQKEMEEKRMKGLCFYCDQKYFPGHKCSSQVFLLEVLVDQEGDEQEKVEVEECLDAEIVW